MALTSRSRSTTRKTAASTAKQSAPEAAAPAAPEKAAAATVKQAQPAPKTTPAATPSQAIETPQAQAPAAQIQNQLEKNQQMLANSFSGYKNINQTAVAACMETSQAMTQLLEAMIRELQAFSQEQQKAGSEAAKSMMAARSGTELFQLQSNFARNAVEAMVSQSAKMTQMTFEAADTALKPFQSNFADALKLWTKPLK